MSLYSSLLVGSELAVVVAPLKDPTVGTAKRVLAGLDEMIAKGDARTVTLGKKVHRSVKRIFTKEFKMLAGRKASEDREARARQLDRNGKQWLKPNAHGDIDKNSASIAFRKAKALRLESLSALESHSKEWAEEVADYEKMLSDLEFSKEEATLLILADLLQVIVERTPWVKKPPLKFDKARTDYIRHFNKHREQWVTLAKHASDAENYELAYDYYRKAGMDLARFRVGASLANHLISTGKPGSAINQWERVGELKRAQVLRTKHPSLTRESFFRYDEPGLNRFVAPACVRISIPGGHRTAFFFRQGGCLLTCKSGLLDKEGRPNPITVTLEDGRKLPATILGYSSRHDIAALRIEHTGHELLSFGSRVDLKPGDQMTLFGFPDAGNNVASSSKGAVMSPNEQWQNQPTSRLALDGTPGHRGAPVVDDRGRVAGIFLTSRTGTARALEVEAIKEFLKDL